MHSVVIGLLVPNIQCQINGFWIEGAATAMIHNRTAFGANHHVHSGRGLLVPYRRLYFIWKKYVTET
jgi:hypothetical protein